MRILELFAVHILELHITFKHGWMAERSKALVLGTSFFGSVGSNPTPVIGELAQSEEYVVRNDEARGSKPRFSNG